MAINLAEQFRPISKESQLHRVRIKPTQKELGAINQKVDRALKMRSGGHCELKKKCTGAMAVQRAHITARGKLTSKTTVDDLLHTCVSCHQWLDGTPEGIQYKRSLK